MAHIQGAMLSLSNALTLNSNVVACNGCLTIIHGNAVSTDEDEDAGEECTRVQCSICRRWGGFNPPSGASQPPSLY